MLDSSQKELIKKMNWTQFIDVLGVLEIDAAFFSKDAPPANRVPEFQNQVELIANNRSFDTDQKRVWLADAFQQVLGMTAAIEVVKEGSVRVKAGLSEVVALLSDDTSRAAVIHALAPAKSSLEGLSDGILAMSRCKEAHEALHNLSLMLPQLLSSARSWLEAEAGTPEKSQRTLELRQASGGIAHNVRKFADTVALLPPPSNDIFGNTADFLGQAVEEVRNAVDDPVAGDPEMPIISILQPNIRQKPSELQNLIAQQASALPFNEVITALTVCDFSTKDDTLGAMTTLRDGTSAIEKQHHEWQFIDNQIKAMEVPIENLGDSPAYGKQAAMILKFLRKQLEEACSQQDQDGINQTILQLADSVAAMLADEGADLWKLRLDFQDLLGNISQRFYATDSSLLNACRDMEPLCDPLLHLVNAL